MSLVTTSLSLPALSLIVLPTESESDDHFSDAQSNRNSQSIPASPIPITRVEKVDDTPSYGEVPGTEAYQKREGDAHPDQIAILGDPTKTPERAASSSPGGQPIPITIVERVDDKPAHGEVPGTAAHAKHAADAVPDIVLRSGSRSPSISRSRANSTPGDLPIPITRVERVDSEPRHGEVPGTEAYDKRKGDAKPDEEVEVGDVATPGKHDTVS